MPLADIQSFSSGNGLFIKRNGDTIQTPASTQNWYWYASGGSKYIQLFQTPTLVGLNFVNSNLLFSSGGIFNIQDDSPMYIGNNADFQIYRDSGSDTTIFRNVPSSTNSQLWDIGAASLSFTNGIVYLAQDVLETPLRFFAVDANAGKIIFSDSSDTKLGEIVVNATNFKFDYPQFEFNSGDIYFNKVTPAMFFQYSGASISKILADTTSSTFQGLYDSSSTNGTNVNIFGGTAAQNGNSGVGGKVSLYGGTYDSTGDLFTNGIVRVGITATSVSGGNNIAGTSIAGVNRNDFVVEGNMQVTGSNSIFANGIGVDGKLCPSNYILLGGSTANKTLGIDRSSTGVAGKSLTIQAGWAASGGTNLGAGDLILAPGKSTGSNSGAVQIQAVGGLGSGTTDRTPSTVFSFTHNGLSALIPFTKYNNITLVNSGIASEVAKVDLAAQSAAIGATTLFTPTTDGKYRVSIYLQVTRAATTSSVLGGATGVTITYTDGDGVVAQSIKPLLVDQAGAVIVPATGNVGNTTTTNSQGSCFINVRKSVAIQYAIGYTSVGATTMQYAVHIVLEAM